MLTRCRTLFLLALMLIWRPIMAEAPVVVEAVASRPIVREVSLNGTVTSPQTAVLSSAVGGLVAELYVDQGLVVRPGDPLLTLDAELAELAHERFLAEVQQREAALADAQRRLADAEKIATSKAIARTTIESLRAEVAGNSAALAAAVAAAKEQNARVERHYLKAPFGGVISQRQTEVGEWVNPGDGLLELVATEALRIDFQASQDLYAQLNANTRIAIRLDALPGQVLNGRVDTIVPVNNPSARTFLVRVLADGLASDGSVVITPGMSARGLLSIDSGRNAITVPRDAILRFPDGRVTVWVVETQQDTTTVRERIVQTGLEFDGVVEINTGLVDAERVVVRGNETLQDGQVVTIVDGIR